MAVAFRASGSGTGTYSATRSPAVAKPGGVTDGDIVFHAYATDTNHALTAGQLSTLGWNLIASANASTDSTLTVIWRVASGEPGTWTMTNLFDATESGAYGVVTYSGQDTTTPINTSASGSAGGTAKSGPSITPNVDNCMILQFGGADGPNGLYNATPDTSPVGTERFDFSNGSVGWVFVQEYEQTTQAALALDHTTSGSLTTAMIQLAIAPATVAAEEAPILVMAPPRR